ncbi:MAG: hypothetical protein L6R39_003300 [Caloplaca ligustica]|nr:MAG: hypothetical protein L6R39_003300 [Caloplaca ligustica]
MVLRKHRLESSDEKPRRSSRLRRHVGERADKPASRVPYLPPEIIGIVAEHLCKSNLKNLRYVSKTWRTVVNPLLFDRVYISPHKQDLDIFEKITSHPVLATSVKTLTYDVSTFFAISKRSYFELMCREIRYASRGQRQEVAAICHPQRFAQLVHAAVRGEHRSLYWEYENDPIIQSGLDEWRHCRLDELEGFASGSFASCLSSGLCRLSNLRSVRTDDDVWGRAVSRHGSGRSSTPLDQVVEGSPLARSWKPFHPTPRFPKRTDKPNVSEHLVTIVGALCKSKRRVREFCFGAKTVEGPAPGIFSGLGVPDDFPHGMKSSLWQLETLGLTITPTEPRGAAQQRDHNLLGFLPDLLNCMTGLKCLFLNLTSRKNKQKWRSFRTSEYNEAYFTYDHVFLREGRWPHLTELQIAGVAMTGLDLFYLLCYQTPHLDWLRLGPNDPIIQKTWEGVVKLLRYYPPFNLLAHNGDYCHAGGSWWPCPPGKDEDEDEEARDSLEKYKEYFTYNAKHPSLPASYHFSAPERYAWQLLQMPRTKMPGS